MATKKEIKQLVKDLTRYAHAYYSTDTPLISDEEYDALEAKLRGWDPDHEFFDRVGASPAKGTPFKHKEYMLSTNKAFKHEELEQFVKNVQQAAKDVGVKNPKFRVTPKLDGMAGKDKDGILATRGNGRTGSVVTHIFDLGVVPIGGRNQGIGEIVMSQSYFDTHLADLFSHPRNVVVGCVNADTLRKEVKQALKAKAIHFMPYTKLAHWTGSGAELLANIKKITRDLENKVDYPLDGMVAEATDPKIKKHMGATDKFHRWQIAIKTEGENKETTVNEIGWQTGKTGVVTPVLRVKPVEVDGAVISNITAHNAGNVKALGLGKGAKVKIIRSGGVIPKLKEVVTTAKVSIPSKCPSCGADVKWRNDFIVCSNTKDCPAQSKTGLFYFFKTIENAKGFGKKTIETLVKNGYTSIESIFGLTRLDFVDMGFGDKQSENLEQALQNGINTEIEDARFLASFGIGNLGIGASRKLLSHYRFETLKDLTQSELEAIDGFGDKTSGTIVDELKSVWPTIQHIYDLGFTLTETPLASEFANIESPIAGKKICFTGKMVQVRDDMEAHARELGATIAGVSKSLDYLVIGGKASQGKIDKANKYGATVLTEAEYDTLIGK